MAKRIRNERQAHAAMVAAPTSKSYYAGSLRDYNVIDGIEANIDEFEYFSSLQRQINSGQIWMMQGSAGRAAMDAINSGRCMCGTEYHRDYYGNVVPSRTQVKSGTKGSRAYVVEHHGESWANGMEAA